jgi:3-dehydroquinate synthase
MIKRTPKTSPFVARDTNNESTRPMSGEAEHESGFDMTSSFGVDWRHVLRFTDGALDPRNEVLADALAGATEHAPERKMIAIIDQGVTDTNRNLKEELTQYLKAHVKTVPVLMEILDAPGGELAKQGDDLVSRVMESIDRNGICRKSVVLVIGGGAVLDAAGYAAAIAHRGVRLVRMPTTVLGQCDSGVGVKNGINRFGKKNFVGAFAPPNAVVCDQRLLRSLSDEDWRSGFSEIVKIALLQDPALFKRLEEGASAVADRDLQIAMPLIARSAQLHLKHITEGGDPFELNEARPLDFGHWSAHKLEQLSDFQLTHGFAVSIGIALDMVYARQIGLVEEALVDRTLRLLNELGLPLSCDQLRSVDCLLHGLEEFREHLGGQLTITVVRGLGSPVDLHEIDQSTMAQSISEVLLRAEELQPHRSPNS